MDYDIFINLLSPYPECNIGYRYQVIGVLNKKWFVLFESKSGHGDVSFTREIGFQHLEEHWQNYQNKMKEIEENHVQ